MSGSGSQTPAEQIRYQLRVTLLGSEPPIWRLVEVPGSLTLGALHHVIQIAMGWDDSHLHNFASSQAPGSITYGPNEGMRQDWIGGRELDENAVAVSTVLQSEGSILYYCYDFGDNWDHEILVEKRFEVAAPDTSIQCLDGQRACPPEDSGGIWGYTEALELLRSEVNGEYVEDLREWYGDDFDPELFDLGRVQAIFSTYQVPSQPARQDSATRRAVRGNLPAPAPAFRPWLLQEPVRRAGPKIGPNDPCPCGSGRKYKKCCRD